MPRYNFNKLVRAAKEGNQTAYQSLYEATVDSVYATCAKYLNGGSDVTRVVDDIYLTLFQSLDLLDVPKEFASYAVQTAVNQCLNANRLHPAAEKPDAPASHDAMDVIGYVLTTLTDGQRTAALLKNDGYSVPSISELLGVTDYTVNSDLYFAKKKIQAAIDSADPDTDFQAYATNEPLVDSLLTAYSNTLYQPVSSSIRSRQCSRILQMLKSGETPSYTTPEPEEPAPKKKVDTSNNRMFKTSAQAGPKPIEQPDRNAAAETIASPGSSRTPTMQPSRSLEREYSDKAVATGVAPAEGVKAKKAEKAELEKSNREAKAAAKAEAAAKAKEERARQAAAEKAERANIASAQKAASQPDPKAAAKAAEKTAKVTAAGSATRTSGGNGKKVALWVLLIVLIAAIAGVVIWALSADNGGRTETTTAPSTSFVQTTEVETSTETTTTRRATSATTRATTTARPTTRATTAAPQTTAAPVVETPAPAPEAPAAPAE